MLNAIAEFPAIGMIRLNETRSRFTDARHSTATEPRRFCLLVPQTSSSQCCIKLFAVNIIIQLRNNTAQQQNYPAHMFASPF
jgi:hypothetical protein